MHLGTSRTELVSFQGPRSGILVDVKIKSCLEAESSICLDVKIKYCL